MKKRIKNALSVIGVLCVVVILIGFLTSGNGCRENTEGQASQESSATQEIKQHTLLITDQVILQRSGWSDIQITAYYQGFLNDKYFGLGHSMYQEAQDFSYPIDSTKIYFCGLRFKVVSVTPEKLVLKTFVESADDKSIHLERGPGESIKSYE